LAKLTAGAWKLSSLFSGWGGLIIGAVAMAALPFLAPAIAAIGGALSTALSFVPILGGVLSGVTALATTALTSIAGFLGGAGNIGTLFGGAAAKAATLSIGGFITSALTNVATSVIGVGVSYLSQKALGALGVQGPIANILSSIVTGGITGGVKGAITAAVSTGVNYLALKAGLDPSFASVLSIGAGAVAGSLTDGLKNFVTKPKKP